MDREGLVLVHNGASCEPNFNEMGLSGFGRHPDMFSLLSVDVDHAEKVRPRGQGHDVEGKGNACPLAARLSGERKSKLLGLTSYDYRQQTYWTYDCIDSAVNRGRSRLH